jgi:hypothetical protein
VTEHELFLSVEEGLLSAESQPQNGCDLG